MPRRGLLPRQHKAIHGLDLVDATEKRHGSFLAISWSCGFCYRRDLHPNRHNGNGLAKARRTDFLILFFAGRVPHIGCPQCRILSIDAKQPLSPFVPFQTPRRKRSPRRCHQLAARTLHRPGRIDVRVHPKAVGMNHVGLAACGPQETKQLRRSPKARMRKFRHWPYIVWVVHLAMGIIAHKVEADIATDCTQSSTQSRN